MNQYKITVNGVAYDVQVELVSGSPARGPRPISRAAAPRPVAPAAAPAAPIAAPAAPAVAPAAPAAAGAGQTITAPMPGNILKVNVAAGQAVKKGDVLIVLEAMKMENEIMAPADGTVTSVAVSAGQAVTSGAALCTLQ